MLSVLSPNPRKSVVGGGLVVFVIRNQGAAEVGGEDLGGFEVGAGKGRCAGTGNTDEGNEGEGGEVNFHFFRHELHEFYEFCECLMGR